MIHPLVLLAAFAAALPAAADEPKLPGPKIEWPEVKGFTYEKPYVFKQAELGYSVAYKAPGLVATVYVYNKGLAEIPTGVKSDVVRGEMKQIVTDMDTAKKRGLYTSVKEVGKEEVVVFGEGNEAPTALRRMFEVERPGETEASLSDAYITGYKGQFIKLRVSYTKDGAGKSEKLIQNLLAALGPQLK